MFKLRHLAQLTGLLGPDPPLAAIPPQYEELWAKLEAFPIDDPAAEQPLSKRLAKEQGWTHEYALRVVEEYRKFIFLTMISERMCTPSLAVDEAWHLHLIYTRSYWEGLCLRTLGRLIHHEPGDGNAGSEEVFQGHYLATLELYSSIFGEPPEDIWGRKVETRQTPGTIRSVDRPVTESERSLMAEIEKAAERIRRFG